MFLRAVLPRGIKRGIKREKAKKKDWTDRESISCHRED
jgi:hypothetical protein